MTISGATSDAETREYLTPAIHPGSRRVAPEAPGLDTRAGNAIYIHRRGELTATALRGLGNKVTWRLRSSTAEMTPLLVPKLNLKSLEVPTVCIP